MTKLFYLAASVLLCTACATPTTSSIGKTAVAKTAADATPDGVVCFRFTIMPDGSVADAEIYKSEPAGKFESEARRALGKWKFRPAIVDGKPVAQPDAKYCLDFKLDESQTVPDVH